MKAPGQAGGAGMGPRAGPCAVAVGPNWAGAEHSCRARDRAAGPAGLHVHSGQHSAEPAASLGHDRADLSPSPKDEERELGRGQVTQKLEAARGQRRAWVEGQKRAESKGRTSTGRSPDGQSTSRGEFPEAAGAPGKSREES